MKKFVSFVLTILMITTLLFLTGCNNNNNNIIVDEATDEIQEPNVLESTLENIDVNIGETKTITGIQNYGEIRVYGELIIESGAVLNLSRLTEYKGAKITLEEGATLNCTAFYRSDKQKTRLASEIKGGDLIVKNNAVLTAYQLSSQAYSHILLEEGAIMKTESVFNAAPGSLKMEKGVYIESGNKIEIAGSLVVNSGSVIKAKNLIMKSEDNLLLIYPGASVETEKANLKFLDIYGSLKITEGIIYADGCIFLRDGCIFDVMLLTENKAKEFAQNYNVQAEGRRVYIHKDHAYYNGVCACGQTCPHEHTSQIDVCDDCGAQID